MWRFWSCIPRVLRQQFHGPRASVGVCVEEEKAEHEVENSIKETLNGGPDSKDQHGVASFCAPPNGDKGPEGERWKDSAHHKHSDWWNHYCHDNFWHSFCSQHRTLEAVTWGAAVVLGLQLSRRPNLDNYLDLLKCQEKRQQWRSLLFRMAFAMPPGSGFKVTKSVLPQQNEKSVSHQRKSKAKAEKQATSVLQDNKTLADVMQDFMTSCEQYTAVGSSVSAVCAADQGNMTAAVKHLQLASELGHAPACFNLAVCYEMGSGVKKDPEQAALYYKLAADVGHAASAFNLAMMILKGEGGVTKDRNKAMQLLNLAAQKGLTQAQTYLGVYYTEDDDGQQNLEQAASFFRAAANQNDAEGQFFLGICYENGWGVDCDDKEAAKLYSCAASLGHDGAMYNLAAFHEHGLGGVCCDKEEAMTLYKQSSQLGNESAKFRLQEIEALQAISQLPDQTSVVSTGSSDQEHPPGLQQNSHSSSPTLTDYLRESITTVLAGGLAAWSSSDTVANVPLVASGENPCGRATFTLGGEDDCYLEDSQGHLAQNVSYYFLDFSSQHGNMHCLTGIHRTVTMPELSAISCQ